MSVKRRWHFPRYPHAASPYSTYSLFPIPYSWDRSVNFQFWPRVVCKLFAKRQCIEIQMSVKRPLTPPSLSSCTLPLFHLFRITLVTPPYFRKAQLGAAWVRQSANAIHAIFIWPALPKLCKILNAKCKVQMLSIQFSCKASLGCCLTRFEYWKCQSFNLSLKLLKAHYSVCIGWVLSFGFVLNFAYLLFAWWGEIRNLKKQ